MEPLDCVVIGYNEGDFQEYRAICEGSGAWSPTQQIYSKEYLEVDGRHYSFMDGLSVLRNRATGRDDRYHVGEVHNLAGIYLSNFLHKAGFTAEAVSLFSAELERLTDLLGRGPAVVAVTTTFYVNIMPVLPVIDFVREHAPDAHIVVGGPLVDNLCLDGLDGQAQDMMDAMGADSYIVESQGEAALVELVAAVKQGRSVDGLANVITLRGEKWLSGPRTPEANSVDHASINWSAFSPELIGRTAQTRTARSCAFKCSFCDYPQRAGALTTSSVDTVRHELRQMAELGVKNLVFVDDTFNVPPKRFKEICRMLIEEDLGLNWYSYFRCSNARDQETFDLAAESGCRGVFLGIESGDQDILAAMNKLAQDAQYRNGIAELKKRGITTFASIIVGFPGENETTVQNTIDFLNETGPTFWRAQAWWGNPKAPVYQRKEIHGIKGEAYNWSHRTMDSAEAARWCDVMFDKVTESTWLPLYDFDFWALPYLDGMGMKVDELLPILRISQEIMRERGRAVPDAVRLAALNDSLYKTVAAVGMAPSRFAFGSR
ncbi:PhpK family radical SAM P-methyltransferase [Streptacidiphilus sp. P02-A3a]|uniref:PhpK family radical SAM P-methyltransferase n=1 Tax=Streptacidiphilus sp. P02-A3a TaxID=2704468 RepID=UPI0015FA855D|nr:PhpK family radical SAM P-methyltransferase [Streptacidiphilus sp. P02-A3a]QMU70042.1 PhpK family radical SAM P-methyltransferase [Streptacidiphilus sp. P02-A3a]